jgi:hypothetical protein
VFFINYRRAAGVKGENARDEQFPRDSESLWNLYDFFTRGLTLKRRGGWMS